MLRHKIALVFFTIYLAVGYLIFKDYGLSFDEKSNIKKGLMSLNYIYQTFDVNIELNRANVLSHIPELKKDKSRFHGPFFEIILAGAGEILQIKDSRYLFLLRHFLTFLLFWISVIFFYLTILSVFKNKWLAIVGCLFLVLSPRIFAHSFYNSKDLAFMSFCIFAIYTQTKFLTNKNYLNAILHALCCGLLVDIRIAGLYIPCLTVVIYYADSLITKEINLKKFIYIPATFIFSLVLFIYIFWPYLWEDPINNFAYAFNAMKQYRWSNEILYWGSIIKPKEIPWHYIPSWILITTPIVYSILFFTGLITNIINLLKAPSRLINYNIEKYVLLFMLLFFAPLIAVIVFKSTLYSGWRHMYFIYPPFILIALAGLYYLINSKFIGSVKYKSEPKVIIILITVLSLLNTAWQMIGYHPHQNVYFNSLVGKKVLGRFDMDYWGLSYKQLYEHILKISDKKEIKVAATHYPGKLNLLILSAQSRKRINLVGIKKNYRKADYVMTHYRKKRDILGAKRNKFPYKNEIYSVKVNDTKIATVFQPNKSVKK